jgi:plasmid maintenance system antidote protein VapI
MRMRATELTTGEPHPNVASSRGGKRGITAGATHRLARDFGTIERFWLDLQSR